MAMRDGDARWRCAMVCEDAWVGLKWLRRFPLPPCRATVRATSMAASPPWSMSHTRLPGPVSPLLRMKGGKHTQKSLTQLVSSATVQGNCASNFHGGFAALEYVAHSPARPCVPITKNEFEGRKAYPKKARPNWLCGICICKGPQ